MSNSLLSIISCYGKVGYYPFFSVLAMLFYNTSYLFILFDLINKRAYFSSSTLILNVSIFFRCSEFRLVLTNLVIIISSIRIITSIKLGFRYSASSIPSIPLAGVAIGAGSIPSLLIFSIRRNPIINSAFFN